MAQSELSIFLLSSTNAMALPVGGSSLHHGTGLRGRRHECESLDRLLQDVRRGQSRVLVLQGEPGVGKTVLLEYQQANASGSRIARAADVESETAFAFAGAHSS